MEIRLGSLSRDAQEAQGTAIIIDVFRAFTTAAIAFGHGAKEIILFAEPDDALALHKKGVGDFLMGEVGGKKPDGFDFGNSPYEISQVDLTGKTLIQSTRAGTVGVEAASNASEIFLGSFVVAQATVYAIKREGPELVSIIAMGDQGVNRADEDEHCGIYLRNIMEDRKPDFEAVKSLIMAGGATQKFFDPEQPQFHPEDVTLALEADLYDFAMKISREDGLLVARKQQVRP
ncbi:MAG: 2-phosphosulfolactate phosphatase [SAR202 cluster bacterium]|jgi:2-phosphosulfolactate phosphatase|nr:2-phosphosulfolactate phosphatase [Dehalococcoidia bacterium]MQF87763.1 2-phosphosulfolactate phosphatase [SAR202 cluster bacterium]|tara:strand:+ start:1464 stop:2159 length:696 start_codon:yes stop_codon:yes gene_type:complete